MKTKLLLVIMLCLVAPAVYAGGVTVKKQEAYQQPAGWVDRVSKRGSNWAAPMDSLIGFFKAVNPAYVNSGAPRAYWVSTTPADSIRFMIINNMTGRGLLKKAYIGRRD